MKKILSITCVLLMVLSVFFFPVLKDCVLSAVEMCIVSIIPSVFVFTVLSSIITDCEAFTLIKPLTYVFEKLFGISTCSTAAVILGWTSGFPTGAVCTAKLYQSGCISKSEAEYLLSFCSVSGISFVFGVMGGMVFNDAKVALLLYLIQIFASVAVALLMKNTVCFTKNVTYEMTHGVNIAESIVSSVKNGVKTTAYICGYIIFFSSLCGMIVYLLPFIPEFLVKGTFEITSSAFLLKDFPFKVSLVLASALLSWSGMCVHFQIRNSIGGLSLKKYYIGKILHVSISSLITLLIPITENIAVSGECISVNYRNNSPDLFFLIIFFAILGCIFLKNDVE